VRNLPSYPTSVLDSSGKPWLPDATQSAGLFQQAMEAFQGASQSSFTGQSWFTYLTASDAELNPERLTLVARSRDLNKNNSLASGAYGTLCDNVIGTGLTASPSVNAALLGLDNEEAQLANLAIKNEWELFANSVESDIQRRMCFEEKQQVVYQNMNVDGDVLVSLPVLRRPGSPFLTKVQVLETERVENPNHQIDSYRMVQGVEKDEFGAPLAYHVADAHPGDGRGAPRNQWTRLDAFGQESGRRLAWLLYSSTTNMRLDQTRGVPYLTAILTDLQDASVMKRATIASGIIANMFTVFVKSPTVDTNPILSMLAEHMPGNRELEKDGFPKAKMGFGNVIPLYNGQEIEHAQPTAPNLNFGPFMDAMATLMGAGIGIPKEVYLHSYPNSFSASRASMLDAWKRFRRLRKNFILNFCQPIFETVITEAVLLGRLVLPGFLTDIRRRRAWLRCLWNGPSMGMIDPVKEIVAARERVKLTVSNLTQETAELTGRDWEEVHTQRVREIKKQLEAREEMGIISEGGEATDPLLQALLLTD
jgi:lambda family phage portal protein